MMSILLLPRCSSLFYDPYQPAQWTLPSAEFHPRIPEKRVKVPKGPLASNSQCQDYVYMQPYIRRGSGDILFCSNGKGMTGRDAQ
jgi:hypothetical protein